MSAMELADYILDPNLSESHRNLATACAKLFLKRCPGASPSVIMKDGVLLLQIMREDYVAQTLKLEDLDDRMDILENDRQMMSQCIMTEKEDRQHAMKEQVAKLSSDYQKAMTKLSSQLSKETENIRQMLKGITGKIEIVDGQIQHQYDSMADLDVMLQGDFKRLNEKFDELTHAAS